MFIKRVKHFLQYHNAANLIFFSLLIIAGSAFANEDVREAVIGEKVVSEEGFDNVELLAADLDNFNIELTIRDVEEDDEFYFASYDFETFRIGNARWQKVIDEEILKISKYDLALQDKNLEEYIKEELYEVAGKDLSYIKEAQKQERGRGRSEVKKVYRYSGLIGLAVNLRDTIFSKPETESNDERGEQIFEELSPVNADLGEAGANKPIAEQPAQEEMSNLKGASAKPPENGLPEPSLQNQPALTTEEDDITAIKNKNGSDVDVSTSTLSNASSQATELPAGNSTSTLKLELKLETSESTSTINNSTTTYLDNSSSTLNNGATTEIQ